jgi:hypothetical protein
MVSRSLAVGLMWNVLSPVPPFAANGMPDSVLSVLYVSFRLPPSRVTPAPMLPYELVAAPVRVTVD